MRRVGRWRVELARARADASIALKILTRLGDRDQQVAVRRLLESLRG